MTDITEFIDDAIEHGKTEDLVHAFDTRHVPPEQLKEWKEAMPRMLDATKDFPIRERNAFSPEGYAAYQAEAKAGRPEWMRAASPAYTWNFPPDGFVVFKFTSAPETDGTQEFSLTFGLHQRDSNWVLVSRYLDPKK